MAKIGMIGAGSWGTALTYRLSENGHEVDVWSIDASEVDMINHDHEQKIKLPGTILKESVKASTDLASVMSDKDLLVLAVPSPFTRSTAAKMAPYVRYGQLIVSVAKGIEESTLETLQRSHACRGGWKGNPYNDRRWSLGRKDGKVCAGYFHE